MHFQKASILLFLLSLIAVEVFSQKHGQTKSTYTKTRFNYNAAQVKGAKAKTICPVFVNSKYPYQGFGFKLGDPFAVTYKYYASKNFSIAADAGKASSGLYNRYFRDKFDEYVNTDTLSPGATLTYFTHLVKSDWMGEVKFLYSFDAKRISPGLQTYVGLGAQVKSTQLQYRYQYQKSVTENTLGTFNTERFTCGVVAVIGIEYAYFQIPISAFMEMELFTDVLLDPGYQRFQGGVGLRYVF